MTDVTVIGLGKLGLPMAAVWSAAGHAVTGIDSNETLIARLDRAGPGPAPGSVGEVVTDEPGVEALLRQHPLRQVSTDYAAAKGADLVLICVPTPSRKDGAFDNQYVVTAINGVRRHILDETPVVVCSTVMPGSMDGELREARGFANRGVLVYSPSFIALGDVVRGLTDPDNVMIGALNTYYAERYREQLETVLTKRIGRSRQTWVSIPINVELAKLIVNCSLSLKVALGNLCGFVGDQFKTSGADIASMVGADPRIGGWGLTPGGPASGPCLPRDLVALAAVMPITEYRAATIAELLRATKAVGDAKVTEVFCAARDQHDTPIGILGLAYKPGTRVTDASLGLQLVETFSAQGTDLIVHDPAAELPPFQPGRPMRARTVDYPEALLQDCNTIVLACPHPEYETLRFLPRHTVIDPFGFADRRASDATFIRPGHG